MSREEPCPRTLVGSYSAALTASWASPQASRLPYTIHAIRPPLLTPCETSWPNGLIKSSPAMRTVMMPTASGEIPLLKLGVEHPPVAPKQALARAPTLPSRLEHSVDRKAL